MSKKALVAVTLAVGFSVAQPAHGDVSIGIHVGPPAPPPPIVVTSPPQLVVVPSTSVYYVPSASFNLFVYRDRYYSFHNGGWFMAAGHNGPWTVVVTEHVPAAVRAVPVTYYKIPPGQAKKMGGHEGPPGHAKGPKGKKGWE